MSAAAAAKKRKEETEAALLLANSTPAQITLEQINAVINTAIEKLERASIERHDQVISKLDTKCKALEVKIKHLESDSKAKDLKINNLTAANARQTELIAEIDKRLASLHDIVQYNILQTNDRHQRDRAWGCRFTNVKFGTLKITAELIYNRIVVPAYQLAVDAGELSEIPTFRQIFDHQHILYRNKTSGAECWLFKFTTRFYLYKFLQHKKLPLNKVNADNGSTLSYAQATRSQRLALTRASQDCTPFNRALISTCIGMEGCGMARISGQGVVVAMKADMVPDAKLTWHKVCDPFGKTIAEMLKPRPTLADLMSNLYGVDNIPPCLKPSPILSTTDETADAAANVSVEAGEPTK